MWPGSEHGYGSGGSLYPKYFIPEYQQDVPWKERVETVLSWMTNETSPANLVFLYHHNPDFLAHRLGPTDPKVIDEIRSTDGRVEYLVSRLKELDIFHSVNLVITSDHGLELVTPDRIINRTLLLDNVKEIVNIYGKSPLLFVQPKNKNITETIWMKLKNNSNGMHVSVFNRSEMMQKFNYGRSRRVSDLILLADDGYAFDDLLKYMKPVAGVHGYDNKMPNMRAIFMGHGPAFKEGLRLSQPISNLDLVSLFAAIVHVPRPPTNGSFELVSQFLISPASATAAGSSVITFMPMLSLAVTMLLNCYLYKIKE